MSQKSQKRKYRQKKQNKTCRINYIPASDKDIKAIIDVNAIKHNINFLRKKTGTDLMPVLKADAYGHGLVEMSKILRKLGIKYIGVATLGEAILLRESGDIIPMTASGKLYVYINGTKRKVLGTISMDQIIVQAKKDDKVSDDCIIFGNGYNCKQTIFDVAKAGDASPVEILCHTGYRINRTYVNH